MRKIPSWIAAALAATAIIAVLALYAVLAVHINFFLGTTTATGTSRVGLVIVVYGAAVSCAVFMAFVALRDRGSHSALYRPILSIKAALFAYLALAGANAYDLFIHNGTVHWRWVYEPEVRLLANLLLLTFVGALAWLLGVMLVEGRGIEPRRVFAWYALVGLLLAAALTVSVIVAQQGVF